MDTGEFFSRHHFWTSYFPDINNCPTFICNIAFYTDDSALSCTCVHASDIVVSDISRIFLGIPFSAGDFEAGAQKDIIVIFEE